MKLTKYWYVLPLAIFFFVTIFFSNIINFYIDWLWFKSVDYSSVFWTIFNAKVALIAVSFIFIFAFIYINLLIAQKVVKKIPVFVTDNIIDISTEDLDINVKLIQSWINRLLAVGIFVLSFFIALGVKNNWNLYLKYVNGVPFGKVDPLFGLDIGFYVFELPLIKAIFGVIISIVQLISSS